MRGPMHIKSECIISGGTHSGKPKCHNAKFIHCIGVVQWNSIHCPRKLWYRNIYARCMQICLTKYHKNRSVEDALLLMFHIFNNLTKEGNKIMWFIVAGDETRVHNATSHT